MKRTKVMKGILLFWTLFIGLGAVYGSSLMFIDPSGSLLHMDGLLPYFQVLPLSEYLYQDYLFPGFVLLIINGLSNLTSAFLIIKGKRSGIILGMIFGITLMLWICIQFIIFPFNIMSTSYFIFGLLQAIAGYIAYVFVCQEEFVVNVDSYRNIDKDSKKLVVYFSRLGYVKKLAYEKANKEGAKILELKTKERTQGTLGFWWCGRFAMHRWIMPIEDININLSDYEEVTICTPVWVFSLCPVIRQFCKEASGKIKKVNYIIVHYSDGKYLNVAKEMDDLLGIKHDSCLSVTCRRGKYS